MVNRVSPHSSMARSQIRSELLESIFRYNYLIKVTDDVMNLCRIEPFGFGLQYGNEGIGKGSV